MAIFYYELIPAARVFLGDLSSKPTYSDDTILTVLRVTTGFLALLGYDKGFTTTFNQIDQDLSEMEKTLYGKAVAVLLRTPKALELAAGAISVRTEEVAYSTETGAGIVRELTQADLHDLRMLIMRLGEVLTARRPDYGLQLGLDSDYFGTDPIND